MKHFNVLITVFVTLALLNSVGQSQAAPNDPRTTIELETPVHFLAPDGSDVLIEPGTYSVEAAEEWIRVVPGERHDALLIEAHKGTHELELEQAMAMSEPGESDDEKDNHYVMLLLPGGQSLEATGTYSGIRPRGFFDSAFNQMKNTAQKVASTVRQTGKNLPKIRSLSTSEKNLAKSVFHNTINYDMVRITNTVGGGGRPWTTNSPPIYTLNVGSAYSSLTSKSGYKSLLIHELTHVWQGQHLVPFMLNSAAHQTLAAINNGGNVATAYRYTLGKRWGQYNVEQQASIVEKWFRNGRKTTDPRYRYIRDNIRKGKVN